MEPWLWIGRDTVGIWRVGMRCCLKKPRGGGVLSVSSALETVILVTVSVQGSEVISFTQSRYLGLFKNRVCRPARLGDRDPDNCLGSQPSFGTELRCPAV